MSEQQPPQTQNSIVIGVATIILTVLGSNGLLEVRNSERTITIKEELEAIARDNHSMITEIRMLTKDHLPRQTELENSNEGLNKNILKQIKELQAEIRKMKEAR